MKSDDRITRLEHLLGVRSVEDVDLIATISDEQLAAVIYELEAYVEGREEMAPRRLKEIEATMASIERANAREEPAAEERRRQLPPRLDRLASTARAT